MAWFEEVPYDQPPYPAEESGGWMDTEKQNKAFKKHLGFCLTCLFSGCTLAKVLCGARAELFVLFLGLFFMVVGFSFRVGFFKSQFLESGFTFCSQACLICQAENVNGVNFSGAIRFGWFGPRLIGCHLTLLNTVVQEIFLTTVATSECPSNVP